MASEAKQVHVPYSKTYSSYQLALHHGLSSFLSPCLCFLCLYLSLFFLSLVLQFLKFEMTALSHTLPFINTMPSMRIMSLPGGVMYQDKRIIYRESR